MKSMTKESVASSFKSAADAGSGGALTNSGKLDTQNYLKQQASGGGDFNKQNAPVRNGTAKTFDDAKDRGPSIGNAAGMTPTVC